MYSFTSVFTLGTSGGWQMGNVPATTECFHQEDRGAHSAAENVDGGALVRQSRALRRHDFEVSHQTSGIAVRGELERALGRIYGFSLRFGFVLEDAQRSQIVFHLLECIEC